MNQWMGNGVRVLGRIALSLVLLACVPMPGWSAQLHLASDTLLRVFDRDSNANLKLTSKEGLC